MNGKAQRGLNDKKVSKSGMGEWSFCTEFCSPMVTANDFPTVRWGVGADGNPFGKCQSCGTIYSHKFVDYGV